MKYHFLVSLQQSTMDVFFKGRVLGFNCSTNAQLAWRSENIEILLQFYRIKLQFILP